MFQPSVNPMNSLILHNRMMHRNKANVSRGVQGIRGRCAFIPHVGKGNNPFRDSVSSSNSKGKGSRGSKKSGGGGENRSDSSGSSSMGGRRKAPPAKEMSISRPVQVTLMVGGHTGDGDALSLHVCAYSPPVSYHPRTKGGRKDRAHRVTDVSPFLA